MKEFIKNFIIAIGFYSLVECQLTNCFYNFKKFCTSTYLSFYFIFGIYLRWDWDLITLTAVKRSIFMSLEMLLFSMRDITLMRWLVQLIVNVWIVSFACLLDIRLLIETYFIIYSFLSVNDITSLPQLERDGVVNVHT